MVAFAIIGVYCQIQTGVSISSIEMLFTNLHAIQSTPAISNSAFLESYVL